ncbi:MAG: proline dehydrogenase family protein [Crocinitomicaceae bacterium]|nr:proline dehydrogenase family protein [Crocinitomicaceae bacterium]
MEPHFDDTEVAFKGKSDRDLKWSYRLFKVIGKPWMVSFGTAMAKFALAIHLPVKGFIKKTIFRQFVGGETIAECDPKIKDLSHFGIGTILDYSVEGKTSEDDLDKTRDEIIATIARAKAESKSIPFSVFKPTGIARFELLEKLNDEKTNLSADEIAERDRYFARFDAICKAATEADIPVFVDAEDSWIQDGIDRMTIAMMKKYNVHKAIVFNTAQMYRHDRLAFIRSTYETARAEKYFVKIKLVRGAYMEKERERAEKMGYPSPIQPDKESTDHDFNAALTYMMERLEIFSLCCGTHNEKSTAHLLSLMEKHGIDRHDKRIFAAQLLGMSDHITYNLAHNGYNVAKYVPYGPVKEVMPYLMRRAQENTSVAGQTGRELSLIIKEKERRKNFPAVIPKK